MLGVQSGPQLYCSWQPLWLLRAPPLHVAAFRSGAGVEGFAFRPSRHLSCLITQQQQGAMESVQHTRFPPDEWFHPDINPKIVQALREIYQVYSVDPSHLYGDRAQRMLGAGSTFRGNRLIAAISCMWQAANDRKFSCRLGTQGTRGIRT